MKRAWIRLAGIGIFHMVLYVYLVPFVIYPKFGENGLTLSIIIAVIISLSVLGSLFLRKKTANRRLNK